jgi:hypothetical protein
MPVGGSAGLRPWLVQSEKWEQRLIRNQTLRRLHNTC